MVSVCVIVSCADPLRDSPSPQRSPPFDRYPPSLFLAMSDFLLPSPGAGSASSLSSCSSSSPFRNLVLSAFVVVSVVHLILTGLEAHLAASITKCFVVPLLALWAALATPKGSCPRPLLLALFFCFLGDLFLELPGCFLPGMGAFACGHVCFVHMFVNRGAGMVLAKRPYIAFWYFCLAVGLLIFAWGGLEGALHFAVPVYACLLVSMASSSMACGYSTGIGGLCFLISDGIILLNQSSKINEDTAPWKPSIVLMILYIIAVWLIAAGSICKEEASARVAEGSSANKDIAESWPRTRIAAELNKHHPHASEYHLAGDLPTM